MVHVTVISSSAQQLEQLLRECGAAVRILPTASIVPVSGTLPEVVVFDVRDRPGIPPALSTLRRQHPELGLMLIAPALDSALLLEAVRAGVNEVVVEPLTREELESALVRVTRQSAPVSGQVFGFIGAKGGVGATTVAVNTATALGGLSAPGRTLIVDLHPAGGDASLFLGVEPRFSVADALQNTHRLDRNLFRNLVTQVAPHTDFMASPEALSPVWETDRLRGLLEFTRTIYRYTVLDLPRGDDCVQEALGALDGLYIVANHDLAAVNSGRRLADLMRQRQGRDVVKVIVSRPDRHANIEDSDIARVTGCAVAHTFPSDYRRAVDALNNGRPVTLDNHNDLSAAFRRFASTLAGVGPERRTPSRSGLLARLTERRTS
jgi:pilus assembly protein CpaE